MQPAKLRVFWSKCSRRKRLFFCFFLTKVKEDQPNCVSIVSDYDRRAFIGHSKRICQCVFRLSIGSKSRRKPRRSLHGSQRDRFPVRELARKRATLRAEYLSKSKELCSLQRQIQRLKKKVSVKFIS